MESEKLWSTTLKSGVNLLRMNEEYVVYEPRSGSTHLLGEVAGQILLFLEYSPANVRRLTAALFTQWEQAPSSEVERSIENVLEELRAMHLIECV